MGLLRFFKRHKATTYRLSGRGVGGGCADVLCEHRAAHVWLALARCSRARLQLDSLKQVDGYLLQIRKDPKVKEDWNRTVMRCGAYVGEVVRRAAPDGCFRWVNFESAVSINSQVKGYGYVVGTSAVLTGSQLASFFLLPKWRSASSSAEQDKRTSLRAQLSRRRTRNALMQQYRLPLQPVARADAWASSIALRGSAVLAARRSAQIRKATR
jgi:hypothetical protein